MFISFIAKKKDEINFASKTIFTSIGALQKHSHNSSTTLYTSIELIIFDKTQK